MEEGVNPKDLVGVKKAPLRLVPQALLIETAPVMALGAEKYGPFNWREYPVKLSVYLEAIQRHLSAVTDGQWLDPESKRPHIAHISACVGIILDARAMGQLDEDWPLHEGPAAKLLEGLDQSKPSGTYTVSVKVTDATAWGDDEPVNNDASVPEGPFTAYEATGKEFDCA